MLLFLLIQGFNSNLAYKSSWIKLNKLNWNNEIVWNEMKTNDNGMEKLFVQNSLRYVCHRAKRSRLKQNMTSWVVIWLNFANLFNARDVAWLYWHAGVGATVWPVVFLADWRIRGAWYRGLIVVQCELWDGENNVEEISWPICFIKLLKQAYALRYVARRAFEFIP